MTAGQTKNKITLTRERPIRRSGGSVVLTIPPELLEVTQFVEGDTVTLAADLGSDEIVITQRTDDK